jgi:HlyD family secretion protein
VRRSLPLWLCLALVLAACSSEPDVVLETATVSTGEVVQTVAAAAAIDAAGMVTVTAPVTGEIEELFVADGDVVAVGDPLLRLSSETIEQQISQAEAAVDAGAAFSEVSAGAGLDLAPVIGAFRSQFDSVLPPLLGVLESQVTATEATLVGVLESAAEVTAFGDGLRLASVGADAGADELPELLAEALTISVPVPPAPAELAPEGRDTPAPSARRLGDDALDALLADEDLDPELRELVTQRREELEAALAAAVERGEELRTEVQAELRAGLQTGLQTELQDQVVAAQQDRQAALQEAIAAALDSRQARAEDAANALQAELDAARAAGQQRLDAAAADARRESATARRQLADAQESFQQVSLDLRQAERAAEQQADQVAAAQAAAVEAQRAQAEQTLEAARALTEDLTIVAPAAGTIELARGTEVGAAGLDVGALTGDLGGVGDLAGGDLGGLLAGAIGPTATSSGPIAEGRQVGVGQPLLSIYDLSRFSATVEVDEIDAVEVAEGQPVTVLVDAFPAAEVRGVVDRVAISPQRGATGGAAYPVDVRLTQVPPEVSLRVGLTASAEIEVRRLDAELVVPTSALLRRGGAEVVFAVREGRAAEVPVQVLAIGDQTAAVDGELAVGERVVTIGVELVEDGDEVDR